MVELPKSQNAVQTRMSAPANVALKRDLNMGQDDEGEPGNESMSEVLGKVLKGREDVFSASRDHVHTIYARSLDA